MNPMRAFRVMSILALASLPFEGNPAVAQLPYGAPLGYPSVGDYGYGDAGGYGLSQAGFGGGMNQGISSWAGSSYSSTGNLGYGGYGTTPYNYQYGGYGPNSFSVYGYGVTTGAVATGYQTVPATPRSWTSVSAPQTTNPLQPVFDVVNGAPGWYQSPHARRASERTRPRVPREQLLGGDGTIRWPIAAPDDAAVAEARRVAERAVKDVVREGKSSGHASVRQVVDAKAKLNAFAREALPKVKTRSAADASGLESFVVELEKTLQTMADRY